MSILSWVERLYRGAMLPYRPGGMDIIRPRGNGFTGIGINRSVGGGKEVVSNGGLGSSFWREGYWLGPSRGRDGYFQEAIMIRAIK